MQVGCYVKLKSHERNKKVEELFVGRVTESPFVDRQHGTPFPGKSLVTYMFEPHGALRSVVVNDSDLVSVPI